jgi:hypothetical protein
LANENVIHFDVGFLIMHYSPQDEDLLIVQKNKYEVDSRLVLC